MPRNAKIVLFGGLVLSTILRAFILTEDHGIYWADEIYQSVEQAHVRVFGFGETPWEFRDGVRNLTFVVMLEYALRGWVAIAGDDAAGYIKFFRWFFTSISLVTALGVYRLGRAAGASATGAAWAAVAYANCGLVLYFGHRAMAECVSAAPLVWGVYFTLRSKRSLWSAFLGGLLISLAVLLRLQNGLIPVLLLSYLVMRGNYRTAVVTGIALLIGAFVYGLTDKLAWGHLPTAKWGGWFHSAVAYVEFNVIQDRASQWGRLPAKYYPEILIHTLPALLLLMFASVLRGPSFSFFVFVFYVLSHSFVPHKELRFILPAFPFLFAELARDRHPWLRPRGWHGLVAVAIVLTLAIAPTYTIEQLGMPYQPERLASAWKRQSCTQKLLARVGARADICGVHVPDASGWDLGAFFYLHNHVPLIGKDHPCGVRRAFNYEIRTSTSFRSGGTVVATEGDCVLVRIGDQTTCPEADQCLPAPPPPQWME